MSRIFISHSSVDDAAALALAQWLAREGWDDYFLDFDTSRGIAPGERWIAALFDAVDRCEAVLFLVSPAWNASKYCFSEFLAAKKLGKRIFGVMVEPIAIEAIDAQMTAEWQLCDLTHADDGEAFGIAMPPRVPIGTVIRFSRDGLDRLARGLRRAGLDASTFEWPPAHDRGRAPYPGLRALDEADAAVFFGRDAQIVRAIDQLRLVREKGIDRLFVILGASGAGKSSFLCAGLLPRLRRDAHFVVLETVRPGNAVLTGSLGLSASIRHAFKKDGTLTSTAEVRQLLETVGLSGIAERMGSRPGRDEAAGGTRPTLIIPIDQAEELFAADDPGETDALFAMMDASRARPGADAVLFMLTIRSDALPLLQEHAAFKTMSPVLFSLPAMPQTEFKAVIDGPAKRHGESVHRLAFTPELADQLVHDAQGADALPLLALTLEWLYREYDTAKGVTRVVTASRDNTARVWDADTGKPVGEALKHEKWVVSASFSPDGKRVVTASWDKTARVWDAETGKPVGEALKHEDSVNAASFSPDGKRVVTASEDHTAKPWDVRLSSMSDHHGVMASACNHMNVEARRITVADVKEASIIDPARIGEDVCSHSSSAR